MARNYPKHLIFMRHGPAGDRQTFAGKDSERPLTNDGIARTRMMAAALAAYSTPELVLTSDYLRATQTADIVVQTLEEINGKAPRLIKTTALRPETTWSAWLEYLHSDAAEFMSSAAAVIVGHQPSISELFAKHLSFDRTLGCFKKSGFGVIAFNSSFERGELVAYVPPKLIQRMKDFK